MGMITLQEACRRLSVSRATLYRWSRQGRLRLYQVGPRSTRVREEDLQELESARPLHGSSGEPWEEAREADLLGRLEELEEEDPGNASYLRELAHAGVPVRWNQDLAEFEALEP